MNNKNIKTNIKRLGYTLADVAKQLNPCVTPSALTQSLNSGGISVARLLQIANICNTTCDELLREPNEYFEDDKPVCPYCGKKLNIKIE